MFIHYNFCFLFGIFLFGMLHPLNCRNFYFISLANFEICLHTSWAYEIINLSHIFVFAHTAVKKQQRGGKTKFCLRQLGWRFKRIQRKLERINLHTAQCADFKIHLDNRLELIFFCPCLGDLNDIGGNSCFVNGFFLYFLLIPSVRLTSPIADSV